MLKAPPENPGFDNPNEGESAKKTNPEKSGLKTYLSFFNFPQGAKKAEKDVEPAEAGGKAKTKPSGEPEPATTIDEQFEAKLDEAYKQADKRTVEQVDHQNREIFKTKAVDFATTLKSLSVNISFGEDRPQKYNFSFESYQIGGKNFKENDIAAVLENRENHDAKTDSMSAAIRLNSINGQSANMQISIPVNLLIKSGGNPQIISSYVEKAVQTTFGAADQYNKSARELRSSAEKNKDRETTLTPPDRKTIDNFTQNATTKGASVTTIETGNREALITVSYPERNEAPLCFTLSNGIIKAAPRSLNTNSTKEFLPESRNT